MWAKLDDSLLDHPKIIAAAARFGGSNALDKATGIYTRALLYAAKHLTDGFIANSVIRRLHLDSATRTMIAVGLWDRASGGVQIHDFHDYNASAAQMRRKRRRISKARSQAGLAGSAARWNGQRQGNSKPHSKRMAKA